MADARARTLLRKVEAFNDVPFFPGSRYLGNGPLGFRLHHSPQLVTKQVPTSLRSLSSDGSSFHDIQGHGSGEVFNDAVVFDMKKARSRSIGSRDSLASELGRMSCGVVVGIHNLDYRETEALMNYLNDFDENLYPIPVSESPPQIRYRPVLQGPHDIEKLDTLILDLEKAGAEKSASVRFSRFRLMAFIMVLSVGTAVFHLPMKEISICLAVLGTILILRNVLTVTRPVHELIATS